MHLFGGQVCRRILERAFVFAKSRASPHARNRTCQLGANYGRGLQLVNILRDVAAICAPAAVIFRRRTTRCRSRPR